MRVDFYALRLDVRAFLGEHKGGLLLAALLCVVFAGLGVYGAYQDEPAAMFAASRHFIVLYIRGDKGLFFCLLMGALETLVLVVLACLLAQVRPVSFLAVGIAAYKAYSGFRVLFIVIRHIGFRSFLCVLFQMIMTLVLVGILIAFAVSLMAGHVGCDRRGAWRGLVVYTCLWYAAYLLVLLIQMLLLAFFALFI